MNLMEIQLKNKHSESIINMETKLNKCKTLKSRISS